jgi:hypothetical protein
MQRAEGVLRTAWSHPAVVWGEQSLLPHLLSFIPPPLLSNLFRSSSPQNQSFRPSHRLRTSQRRPRPSSVLVNHNPTLSPHRLRDPRTGCGAGEFARHGLREGCYGLAEDRAVGEIGGSGGSLVAMVVERGEGLGWELAWGYVHGGEHGCGSCGGNTMLWRLWES